MSELTMTPEEIYKDFCECRPEFSNIITKYQSWGRRSIIILFNDGSAYKVRRRSKTNFVMQLLADEDIVKRFGINNITK